MKYLHCGNYQCSERAVVHAVKLDDDNCPHTLCNNTRTQIPGHHIMPIDESKVTCRRCLKKLKKLDNRDNRIFKLDMGLSDKSKKIGPDSFFMVMRNDGRKSEIAMYNTKDELIEECGPDADLNNIDSILEVKVLRKLKMVRELKEI